MNPEERLVTLCNKISALRRKGHVRAFPVNIRQEAVELADELGHSYVAEKLSLSLALLYGWEKAIPREKPVEPDEVPLEVTRIHRPIVVSAGEEKPLLVIHYDSKHIEIHSYDLAQQICSTLLKMEKV